MTISFPFWLIWTVPAIVLVLGALFVMRRNPGPSDCGSQTEVLLEMAAVVIISLLVTIAVLLLEKCSHG